MSEEDYSFLKEFPYTMIYSQPKVGTTTVMNAVSSVGIPIHRCTAHNVKNYHLTDMPTITPVRDPIARQLSELWEVCMNNGTDPYDMVIEDIMYDILNSLAWFTHHFLDVTGINVFGSNFTKKLGYNIYSIRGLVVVTHRMDKVLEKALLEFLPPYFPDADYDSLKVEHLAVGDDQFGEEYKQYLDGMKFPKEFVEKVYNSEFCKTFFYATTMKKWFSRWKEK